MVSKRGRKQNTGKLLSAHILAQSSRSLLDSPSSFVRTGSTPGHHNAYSGTMHRVLRHVRFSLANVLRATAWLCICAGSFSFLASQYRQPSDPPARWTPHPELELAFIFLFVWTPFVAIGALFGRTKRGMIVGIAVVMVLLLIALTNLPKVQ